MACKVARRSLCGIALGIPVRWERLFASQDAQKPVFYYNGICLQSQVFCNKTNPILLHVQQKAAMHNCTAAFSISGK
jgi:hypothetical protein